MKLTAQPYCSQPRRTHLPPLASGLGLGVGFFGGISAIVDNMLWWWSGERVLLEFEWMARVMDHNVAEPAKYTRQLAARKARKVGRKVAAACAPNPCPAPSFSHLTRLTGGWRQWPSSSGPGVCGFTSCASHQYYPFRHPKAYRAVVHGSWRECVGHTLGGSVTS